MNPSSIVSGGPQFSLRLTDAAVVVAVVLPTLLAYNLPPSSTFFNQAAALIAWGSVLISLSSLVPWPRISSLRKVLLLLVPLALLATTAIASVIFNGLPVSLAASALGIMFAAALVILAGVAASQSENAYDIFRGLCIALTVAGVLGALIGAIQIFIPTWTDGTWLAAAPADERASGNLRQPNHLSSLLVWSLVALAWLWQSRTVPSFIGATIGILFVFGIVLTGSRTGLLDCLVLAVWALLDRKLPRGIRLALVATPVLYALFWWGLAQWAHSTHHVFGGEARMGAQGDISSSRWAIWANTLSLIARHPWFGVGFGEFNFAWSLTPFPDRPVAFFDHTHNLALQFAVEVGLPLAALILTLLVVAIVLAFRASKKVAQPMSSMVRTAFMFVLTIGVHSLFEYPLWYTYFLLPALFAFGFCLGRDPETLAVEPAALSTGRARSSVAFAIMGVALFVGGVGAVIDYFRVAAIFDSEDGEPLVARIAAGQQSIFFKYHADYAAVTTATRPSTAMPAFTTATQNLLDTRLMIAWAKAYAELGDLERAKHIAQRLREFRNENSKEFFAPCTEDAKPRPFQCEAPSRTLDYRDFRLR